MSDAVERKKRGKTDGQEEEIGGRGEPATRMSVAVFVSFWACTEGSSHKVNVALPISL